MSETDLKKEVNRSATSRSTKETLSRRDFLLTQGTLAGLAALVVYPEEANATDAGFLDSLCAISKQLFGIHYVKCFGAKGDGKSLNDAYAIQDAIDAALDENGGIVYFSPGTYICTKTLRVGNNIQLIGAGRGTTRLQFTVTGNTPGIARKPKPEFTELLENLVIRDLSILGQDGSGGCGIELVSAVGACINNVYIDKFRTSSGVGCGVRILNSDQGNCWRNRFDHVDIANCDTGLLMDSVYSGHSCGYMTFTALTIHQERDCVVLKRSNDNGSIYNRFYGLTVQGTSSPGGNYLVIEGSGNLFSWPVFDGGNKESHHIWFRQGSFGLLPAGNRVIGGSFDMNRVKDDNVGGTGGFNTLDNGLTFRGGGEHPWQLNGVEVAPPLDQQHY